MERLIGGLKDLQSPQQPDPAAPAPLDRDRTEGDVVADAATAHAAPHGAKPARPRLRSVAFVGLGAALGVVVLAWLTAEQAGVLTPWPSRPGKTPSSESMEAKSSSRQKRMPDEATLH